jgi:enoyl-CoA hydratase/carnithine racemase
MMLNTDIRVAAKGTRFAQLEVKRGIFACGGATIRLQREIGWGNAQRYLLTGDEWTAEQAYQWGLIQELVEPGEQFNKAMEIAEKIAKAAPTWTPPAVKQRHLISKRFETAALHSASVWALLPGPG